MRLSGNELFTKVQMFRHCSMSINCDCSLSGIFYSALFYLIHLSCNSFEWFHKLIIYGKIIYFLICRNRYTNFIGKYKYSKMIDLTLTILRIIRRGHGIQPGTFARYRLLTGPRVRVPPGPPYREDLCANLRYTPSEEINSRRLWKEWLS